MKIEEVKHPSRIYTFVEEDHLGMYGFNNGGWHLPINFSGYNVPVTGGWNPATYTFFDLIGIWHNKRSTFAFADGHVEIHSWQDERTHEWVKKYDSDTIDNIYMETFLARDNVDCEWLLKGYMDKSRLR